MSVKRIIFWRHGETDANRGLRIQGSIDVPLNERGLSQARRSAPELAELSPSRIYCSDLSRAQTTAQALAELTDIEPIVDPRLRERSYGSWEGLTAAEICEDWNTEYEQWRLGMEPGLDIETREACSARMVACVNDVVAEARETDDPETIVFASHGGAITCAISALLGLNPSVWQGLRVLDNCHWAMLIPSTAASMTPSVEAHPAWRIVMYNRWTANTTDMEYAW